jgi:membrane protease YdiL (CAAX protease family)
MPILAQGDAAGLSAIEYDLLQRAGLIGSIYGTLVLIGLIINLIFALRWRERPWPLRPGMNQLLLRPWRANEVAIVMITLAFGFISALALRDVWLAWTKPLSLTPASRLVLLQSALFHLLGLIVVAALMVRRRLSVAESFGARLTTLPQDILRGLLGLLAALPALLLLTVLFHVVLHVLGYQTSIQEVAFAISDEKRLWMRAYFVVLAVGLAPVFEEILFRGMLLPVLARRYGGWAAILITSFLFAAIHKHLPSFLTLFALSGALSMAYIFSGSIVVPIAMHAIFNGITTAILLSI